MRILVRAPNWIGDQVLAFPFFYYLRKAYPQAEITVACVQWVESIQYRHLIDEVFVLPRVHRGTLWEKLNLIEEASAQLKKKAPYDLGISLPNSLSSAWLLYRSGVQKRRGYRIDGRGLLLNEGVKWDESPSIHRAQAYVNLLPEEARPNTDVKEFWGVPPENELDAGIPGVLSEFPVKEAWPDAHRDDQEDSHLEPPPGDYWVLAPGANAEARSWMVEFFAFVSKEIWKEYGIPGVVVGGPKEAPIAAHLCEDSDLHLLDRSARGSVAGLWKLFRNARFTLSNDSGLAHVAALCGSPVQIAWGAGDPRRTRPIGPGKVNFTAHPVSCWPCERNHCPMELDRKLLCLRGLKPEKVWEGLKNGLNPGSESRQV